MQWCFLSDFRRLRTFFKTLLAVSWCFFAFVVGRFGRGMVFFLCSLRIFPRFSILFIPFYPFHSTHSILFIPFYSFHSELESLQLKSSGLESSGLKSSELESPELGDTELGSSGLGGSELESPEREKKGRGRLILPVCGVSAASAVADPAGPPGSTQELLGSIPSAGVFRISPAAPKR